MILAYHGPKATISERLAAKNIEAIATPAQPADRMPRLRIFIAMHANLAQGAHTLYRQQMRAALEALVDEAFARDQIMLGQADELSRRIKKALPL